MAEVLGPQTILSRALPTGVDGARIAEWEMRDGTTGEEFFAMTANMLGAVNASLMADYGMLLNVTTEHYMEYEDGSTVTRMQPITDVSRPDMVHGTTIGHMLPLEAYGAAIGGSWRYFRDARRAVLMAHMNSVVRRGIWRFEYELFNRFFSNTEVALGSGYSVPFINGTSGNVDFVAPSYAGKNFAATHSHFVFDNSGYDDLLDTMADTLWEHGLTAPYIAIVSGADTSNYSALTNFTQLISTNTQIIDRGGATSGPQQFSYGTYESGRLPLFGFYESGRGVIELRATNRLPTTYAGMFKSMGMNTPGNPLAVRVHDRPMADTPFGMYIVPSVSDETSYPIRRINVEQEFGVGVGMDRTNGTVGRMAGSYANPTIT